MAIRRAALYASETTIAKYFGRRNEGTDFLMGSNRDLNHSAALARSEDHSLVLLPVSRTRVLDGWYLLEKAVGNVVQRPSPFAKVRA
jgi:hypothetical protein